MLGLAPKTSSLRCILYFAGALYFSLAPIEARAQSEPLLTFGGVGYEDSMDAVLKRLITYMNGSHPYILNAPALLSYDDAIAFASRGDFDIAFLPPLVFTKARLENTTRTQDGRLKENLRPVAIALMDGAEDSQPRLDYRGTIYLSDRVDRDTLTLKNGSKATIVVISNSTSGYFFPLKQIAEHLDIKKDPIRRKLDLSSVLKKFNVRFSQGHTESMQIFLGRGGPADIVPVSDQTVRHFLDKPERNDFGDSTKARIKYESELRKLHKDRDTEAFEEQRRRLKTDYEKTITIQEDEFNKAVRKHKENLALVRNWLLRNCKAKADALTDEQIIRNPLRDLLNTCGAIADWSQTDAIPGNVVVIDESSQKHDLLKRVQQSLSDLNLALRHQPSKSDPALDEIREILKRYGIVGFSTNEKQINDRFDKLKETYQKYDDTPQVFGLNAETVVKDIAYDIRYQRGRDPNFHPRIAVVLSGGGASGAYQTGALMELREAIWKVKSAPKDPFTNTFQPDDLRIHMFVGTSVGAINAVAAAISEARSYPSGNDKGKPTEKELNRVLKENTRLRDMWTGASISSRTVFRGSLFWVYWLFKMMNQGWLFVLIMLSLLQMLIFFKICHLVCKPISKLSMHGRLILLAASLAGLFILSWLDASFSMIMLHVAALVAFVFASWFPPSTKVTWIIATCFVASTVHNFYELYSNTKLDAWANPLNLWLGCVLFALSLIVVASYGLQHPSVKTRLQTLGPKVPLTASWRHIWMAVQILIVIVLPVQVVQLLTQHKSFLDPAPLKQKLVKDYWELLHHDVETSHGFSDDANRENEISREILELLNGAQTDLVITATDFTNYKEGVRPTEVYFYSHTNCPWKDKSTGITCALKDIRELRDKTTPRWVNMQDPLHNQKLIDMVMASAAVFPGFPPRRLNEIRLDSAVDSTQPTHKFDLIDGGFLHNVPVQAAVEMGATHIIVIQVQPLAAQRQEKSPNDAGLGLNLYSAFLLLFERAQSADTDALSTHRTFLLAPGDRSIGALDFDGHFTGWWTVSKDLASFLRQGREDATLSQSGEADISTDEMDFQTRRRGFQRISGSQLFH